MTRRIRIDDEALDELVEAARWYEERERGRGTLFSHAAFARVEALSSFPDAGMPVKGVSGASSPARFACCVTQERMPKTPQVGIRRLHPGPNAVPHFRRTVQEVLASFANDSVC